MPVRIIFRGLILFELPESGPNKGTLVAELINKRVIPNRPTKNTRKQPLRGTHEHNHGARIQIATDHGVKDVLKPIDLADRENIAITVPGKTAHRPVRAADGFFDHVPRLRDVMDNASIPTVRRAAAKRPLTPNDDLVRNTITVDSGVLRVRNVVMWDHGAFPLDGNRGARGALSASHVPLRFVGSHWQGHVASEFVVDVWDANLVKLASNKNEKLNRDAQAKGKVNHRVAYDTAEILITNYEKQEHTAVPWGLDFQWLFERVGYESADLAADFGAFHTLGMGFDRAVYDNDRVLLLEPMTNPDNLDDYTRGRPFPYVAPEGRETLTRVQRGNNAATPRADLTSTDEEDRPICIGGFK